MNFIFVEYLLNAFCKQNICDYNNNNYNQNINYVKLLSESDGNMEKGKLFWVYDLIL